MSTIETTTFKRLQAVTAEAEYDFDNKARNILVHNLDAAEDLLVKLNGAFGADDYKTIPAGQSFEFRVAEDDHKLIYQRAGSADFYFDISIN